MATNRHAQIRYTILDRCFSNFNRNYTYNDLLEEINVELVALGTQGIQRRQLQYDINHMKSDAGYRIVLQEDLKMGNKKIFRYQERSFSIADNPLNFEDSEQLSATLDILKRYKHRAEFNWLEELVPRIEQAFDLMERGDAGAIGYQENIDLKGKEHIGVLFNLIIKNKQIKLIYQPYGRDPIEANVSPYHLKQYNNRWFLFCKNSNYDSISNYPLDRIQSIEELSHGFVPTTINWLDYFEDFIGVTKPMESGPPQKIILRFSEKRIQYVQTKPLHGTQRIDRDDKSGRTLSISVIPNRELYQLLLSFGADIEVLAPDEVRGKMVDEISKMTKNY